MVEYIAELPARLRGAAKAEAPKVGQPLPGLGEKAGLGAVRGVNLLLMGFAYLAVGLLLRGSTLGYPIIHIDEQFYLLVGDRMLHGAVPFVDIWDRKPIGLFLLYGAIRLLGGDGILQYQLVALACVAGTSLVIYRMAREIASPMGAWWAGVAYQLFLSAFFCFGGQAPVFYNLLMALAGLGMMGVWTAKTDRRLFLHGLAIMAVVGVSLQIKYTVVFEGIAFGLMLMARAQALGWSHGRILAAATGWAGVALLPTLAAWGAYIAMGHGMAFAQANFLSIFDRHEEFDGSLFRLFKETLALLPVWAALFLAPRQMPPLRYAARPAQGFLRIWAAVAVAGFLLFGTWYDHYVAPLLVPLMALAAPTLGRGRPFRWYTHFMLGIGMAAAAVVTIYNTSHHGTTEEIELAADMIRNAAATPTGQGCVYINEGDPILYHMTNACFVTRYVFPNHLNNLTEQRALGVDANSEMRAVLARRPQVVVMLETPFSKPVNWQSRQILMDGLKEHYRKFADPFIGSRHYQLFVLKNAATSSAQ